MPATHAPHDRPEDVVDEGATSEALGFWGGGLLALAVTLAGSVPGLVLVAQGGGVAGFYAGLAGILASGLPMTGATAGARPGSRADRLSRPRARDVVTEPAIGAGVCIRPVLLRWVDTATGETRGSGPRAVPQSRPESPCEYPPDGTW